MSIIADFILDKTKTTKLNYVYVRRPELGEVSGTLWIKKENLHNPPKTMIVTIEESDSEE